MHILRLVDGADFPALAAIVNPYIEKTAIHFATKPATADELRADWERDRDRYACYVAVVDGAVAGFAKAMTFRSRPAYQWTAEIGVYVDERHHRKGVARALYEKLIATCRAQGFHMLVAGIALPNDASVQLHEALGFARVGTFPEVGYKFGAFHDVGFWTLTLSSTKPVGPVTSPAALP